MKKKRQVLWDNWLKKKSIFQAQNYVCPIFKIQVFFFLKKIFCPHHLQVILQDYPHFLFLLLLLFFSDKTKRPASTDYFFSPSFFSLCCRMRSSAEDETKGRRARLWEKGREERGEQASERPIYMHEDFILVISLKFVINKESKKKNFIVLFCILPSFIVCHKSSIWKLCRVHEIN